MYKLILDGCQLLPYSGDQVVETGMKSALRDILQKGVLQYINHVD